MAIRLGSAYGIVGIKDEATPAVKNIEKSMSGLESSSKSLKGKLADLSGGLGKGGLGGSLNDAARELTGFSLTTVGLGAVLTGIAVGIKKSIGETVKYAEQVRYLSRSLGVNAQEASRLIQVADDLKIEQTQLEMAFKNAQSKGINPNIEGIKQLQKQYKELRTPLERANYAMETFGQRAGPEMQKLLELSNDELDRMVESAEKAGLVMGEDAVQAARDFEIAVDDLSDAFEGLKIKVGTGLLPLLTDLLNEFHELSEVGSWRDLLEVLKKYSGVFGTWGDDLSEIGDGMEKFKKDDFISGIGEVSGAMNGLESAADGASTKIKGVITSLKEVEGAELASKAIDAVNQAFEEGLITQGEYDALIFEIGKKFLGMPESEIAARQNLEYLTKAFDDGRLSAEEYVGILEELGIGWGKIPRNVTTTYTIKYQKVGGIETEPGPDVPVIVTPAPIEPGLVPGGQFGLHGFIPPGYPNDSYLLAASSGERVDITPQGQINKAAGDVYVVQNFYDQGAAALGIAYVETLRGKRLDASMGR